MFNPDNPSHRRGAVAAIALLAAVLGVTGLDTKSLWIDEAVTLGLVTSSWTEMVRLSLDKEPFMAPYHFLLFPWATLNSSAAFVRGFSVLFAVATVPTLYALTARLFTPRIGLVAALLLSVNAYFITYAQEARAYSFLLFLVVLSTYLFVRLLDEPGRRPLWIGYVLTCAVAVNTHVFAGLVLASHGVSLVALPRGQVPWRKFIASVVAILALIPIALLAVFRDAEDLSWIPVPTLRDLGDVFVSFTGEAGVPLLVLYWLFGLAALRLTWRTASSHGRSPETWRYALVLAWLGLPIGIPFLYSLIEPVFVKRYLIVSLPPLVMVGAIGLASIHNPRVFRTVLAATLLLSGLGLANWQFRGQKEDWRGATTYVLAEAQGGDAVGFFAYFVDYAFDYYAKRLDAPAGIPTKVQLSSDDYWIGGTLPDPNLSLLENLHADHARLWLFLSHDEGLGRARQRDDVLRTLDTQYRLLEERDFYRVRVLLYGLQ